MTDISYLHQLAAAFLHALERDGQRLGTGKHLQVQALLQQLPPDADADTLRLALVPLLARNPQEQELLYRRFEECRAGVDAIREEDAPAIAPSGAQAAAAAELRKWRWRIALPLLGMLLLAGAVWWAIRPVAMPAQTVEKSFLTQVGQTKTVCPDEVPQLAEILQKARGTSAPAVEYERPRSDSFPQGGVVGAPFASRTLLADIALAADACLSYRSRSAGRDTIVVNLRFPVSNGGQIRLLYIALADENAETAARPAPADSLRFLPRDVPYPHEQQLLDCALPPQTAWQSLLARHWPWVRWTLLALFSLAVLALWRYWEIRRRQVVAEMQRNDKAPFFWNIRIEGADALEMGEHLPAALRILRRRGAGDTPLLDLPRSISATAAKGGMPEFRFRRRSQPVDYLLLLDRQTQLNHRARLFDQLYRLFKEQEIEIARFFYDATPQICFNETYPEGVALADLAVRHGGARLIIVGTGAQLLSGESGQLLAWTGTLAQWRERVLLSPKPLNDWGRDERRLAELLPVLPATLQGLSFWADELDAGQDARFDEWRNRVHDAARQPVHPDPDNALPTLIRHYDYPLLQWIAACALYPSLHYDLTLWMGNWLAVMGDPEKQNTSVSGTQPPALVTLDNLLFVFRLSWFSDGEMPRTAREQLIGWLERDNPDLLARLRLALAEVLEQNPPPEDSAAWDERRMSVALQRWLGEQDPVKKKQHEQHVAELLEAGLTPDFTVLKYLEKPRGPLDFIVPRRWRKYVQPVKPAFSGWKPKWKFLQYLPSWNISAVWLIILLDLLVFLSAFSLMDSQGRLNLAVYMPLPNSGWFHPHQLLTHLFMHGDLWHLGVNALFLYLFGPRVEAKTGGLRFFICYLLFGLGGMAIYFTVKYLYLLQTGYAETFFGEGSPLTTPLWGSGGAVFGVMAAYALYYSDRILTVPELRFSIKAKYVFGFFLAWEIFSLTGDWSKGALAHFVSLGGALSGFLIIRYAPPEQWGRYLYAGGYAALGWHPRWKNLRWALPLWLAGATALCWPYGFEKENACLLTAKMPAPAQQSREAGAGATVCLDDPACAALYSETLLTGYLKTAPLPQADSVARFLRDAEDDLRALTLGDTSAVSPRFDLLPRALPAARIELPRYSGDSSALRLISEINTNIAAALYNRALPYLQRGKTGLDAYTEALVGPDLQEITEPGPVSSPWLSVSIQSSGELFINNISVNAANLEAGLRTKMQEFGKSPDSATVSVVVDKRAPMERVVLALDVLTNRLKTNTILYPVPEGKAYDYLHTVRLYVACTLLSQADQLAPGDVEYLLARNAACPETPGDTAAQPRPRYNIAAAISGRVVVRSLLTRRDAGGVEVMQSGTRNPLAVTDKNGYYILRLPANYPRPDIQLAFIKTGYELYEETFTVNGVKELPLVELSPLNTSTLGPTRSDSTEFVPSGQPLGSDQIKNLPTRSFNAPGKDSVLSGIPLPVMVEVKGGTFTMGCTPGQGADCDGDEKPAHEVTLSDFAIGKYEVTNAQYCAFLNERGNREEGGTAWLNLTYSDLEAEGQIFRVKKGYEDRPVTGVSWYGARAYCAWLSEKTGRRYRLPTEAEWEYAARGGAAGGRDDFKYSGSNELDEAGWYSSNSGGQIHAVGGKKANQLGLHDMSGNVWEWCSDWYGKYPSEPQTNPAGPSLGSLRVYRGGSWLNDAQDCRVAYRFIHAPGSRDDILGFRLAASPQ